ncbi:MAG: GNAT family N-acetyltransferase [Hymenobacter sp.]
MKLERFAVLPAFRNQGVGEALVHQVLADVQAQAPTRPRCTCTPSCAPFRSTSARGFSKVGEMFEECDIQHYQMVRG